MSGTPTYRQRRHHRLAGYDYTTPGYYFVTICIHDRLPLFGSIGGGALHPSPAGDMVRAAWHQIADLHPGIAIDIDRTMPDHVHSIVVLEDDRRRTLSLPEVVHRYKSLTTKYYARAVRDRGWPRFHGKLWQEDFFDHVVRTDPELDAVRQYIDGNVERWLLRQEAASAAVGP
jgi:REP element-mobilizing transposase RayT